MLLTGRAWNSALTTMPGLSGDPETFLWYLTWWPQAITSGQNPWWTDRVSAPGGINLMWNASMPLVALLLAPVTVFVGGTLTYTLAIVFGFVTTAVCTLLLGRRIFVRSGVQVVFALSVAFCPFMVGHGLGHPNLIWAGYLPLTLRIMVDLGMGRTSVRRSGALLGISTAAQILIGEEIIALTAICVTFLTAWLIFTQAHVATWRRLAGGVLWSQLWFWPLALWPLAVQFIGPYRLSEPLHDTSLYVLDLLSLLAPSRISLLTLARPTTMDWSGGNLLESTGYLGLALPVAVYAGVRGRELQYVRAATWCAAGALLTAVGDHVVIAGWQSPLPGLGQLLGWIPLVKQVLPVRLTLVLDLAVLVLVLSLLDNYTASRSGSIGIVRTWVGLALVCMAPWPVYPESVRPPVPAFFSDGVAARIFGDSRVLALPLARMPESSTAAMVWHASSGQRWQMMDGYVVNNLFAQRVRRGRTDVGPCQVCYWLNNPRSTIGALTGAEVTDQLRQLHVAWVVIGPSEDGTVPAQVVRRVSAALGAPTVTGGVLLWHLRH